MSAYIRYFDQIGMQDVPEVGGKNASLGEMHTRLSGKGICVPDGFAVTASAFKAYLRENNLTEKLSIWLKQLDRDRYTNLRDIGKQAREALLQGNISSVLESEISEAYVKLNQNSTKAMAVRSSATAEDLPEASFAGQHESFLNVRGLTELIIAIKKCFASLYTDRAIKYREEHGFAHDQVALSVGVQQMVRSDKACSGVAFTLEPESGFRNIIHISGVWGLGENLVQGTVTPDEYLVFKPLLKQNKRSIIQKKLGDKAKTMVYAEGQAQFSVMNIDTPLELRRTYVLSEDEIRDLANQCLTIESHYERPMDIEWAKDGYDHKIYILQARPETVQALRKTTVLEEYTLLQTGNLITSGQAIGTKAAFGTARIIYNPKDADQLGPGEIVVTDLTSPDWDPILKNAGAIITNKGGRTSHASIVARELGIPAVVGCDNATVTIKDGQTVTVSCCEGKTGNVYDGQIPFRVMETDFEKIDKPAHTKVMLIIGDPDKAFKLSQYPNDGVGLLRMEFIINHAIQVHPMALINFDKLKSAEDKYRIQELTNYATDKKQFFIDRLAQGVGTVAAAFFPKDVIVRMSDFKTNEYANLIGGADFEPKEENPMIGFRGASRYYNPLYKEGFAMECLAIRQVREDMGFTNIKIMIPFCRTLMEAEKVIDALKSNGLDRDLEPGLEIYMMAEIPSNVLLAEKFAHYFDGFSIGSNDLTQLTLGIDRDSSIISDLFSEQNEAATFMIGMMIEKAVKMNMKIGLCGQAPSDDPEFAQFLVEKGITSISFNPDALLKGIENIRIAESLIGRSKQLLNLQPV